MFRTVVRLSPNIVIPLFSHKNVNDQDLLNQSTTEPKTGWERVKLMYTGNEYEEISAEMNNVVQSAMTGSIVGACLGGFVSSRIAYLNFIENNQATIFKTTAEAKKRLQDYVTIAFAKGAYKWGWRLGLFTGIFSLTANTISVYRGDTSLVEYVTAGALAGALYKIDMGLAGTFVGASLGAVLSGIAGLLIIGLLKLTGVSMQDIKQSLTLLKKSREDHYNQAMEKAAEEKNDELTDHHTMFVMAKGEKKLQDLE